MEDEWYDEAEAEQERIRRARRAKRMEEMRRSKRKQEMIRRLLVKLAPFILGAVVVVVLLVVGVRRLLLQPGNEETEQTEMAEMAESAPAAEGDTNLETADMTASSMGVQAAGLQTADLQADAVSDNSITDSSSASGDYFAQATDNTKQFGEDVISSQAILVDRELNTIMAQRDAKTRINPASMTKILTVLVAAEHVTNLDDTFTVTLDITDYSFENDCSAVGFSENEVVTVRDLFYGTILPSGADAALGLATYVAGSHEAFVELMNDKLKELGISDTAHFTNCVGIYDENHYCTAYDMAVILDAAIDNELCREVLSAHTYTTSSTTEHPDGITISNWFLRRIEDKDSGGTVICGKTGYVVQSGNCAASYAEDAEGAGYICVTVNATSGWRCIYDHVAIYKQFLPAAGS